MHAKNYKQPSCLRWSLHFGALLIALLCNAHLCASDIQPYINQTERPLSENDQWVQKNIATPLLKPIYLFNDFVNKYKIKDPQTETYIKEYKGRLPLLAEEIASLKQAIITQTGTDKLDELAQKIALFTKISAEEKEKQELLNKLKQDLSKTVTQLSQFNQSEQLSWLGIATRYSAPGLGLLAGWYCAKMIYNWLGKERFSMQKKLLLAEKQQKLLAQKERLALQKINSKSPQKQLHETELQKKINDLETERAQIDQELEAIELESNKAPSRLQRFFTSAGYVAAMVAGAYMGNVIANQLFPLPRKLSPEEKIEQSTLQKTVTAATQQKEVLTSNLASLASTKPALPDQVVNELWPAFESRLNDQKTIQQALVQQELEEGVFPSVVKMLQAITPNVIT